MKRNFFIRSLKLSCIFVSVFVGSGATATDVGGNAASIRPEQSAQAVKKPGPLLSISADALLHKLKQNQPITLVDIRSPREFETAKIPGSINIPLYAIKKKAFLKTVPFVLIDDGYRNKSLESQCKTLRAEGFRISFLFGGLNGWQQRGGPLQKDAFEHKGFNRISPQAFYQEKEYEQWIVINASKNQTPTSMELFPNAFHMPVIDHAEPNLLAVTKKTEPGKSNLHCPLLIFNEDGRQYAKIEKVVEKSGLLNVIYLEGGLRAYDEFLNHLAQSIKPRKQRLKTMGECTKCGTEN
jgi:rhodanese-related sulfurtransferase